MLHKVNKLSQQHGSKNKTVKQKLVLLNEEINCFYRKDDAALFSELARCSYLCSWLQCQEFDYASRIKILELVQRACHFDGPKKETCQLMQQLISLKGNFIAFILATVAKMKSTRENYEYVPIVKMVFDVIQCIFQCLPMSALDFVDLVVPPLKVCLQDAVGEMKQELLSEIDELLKQRIGFSQSASIQNNTDVVSPPCDYRNIALLPDKCEMKETDPFLRKNIVKGPYRDAEHYLDIQFRLMREDMFCYLRECIMEYQNVEWSGNSKSAVLKNGNVYFGVKIFAREYRNGIFFVADINTRKNINWNTTKKLKPNSLLCVSYDKFESFAFVCIRSREPRDGTSERCTIRLLAENDVSFNYIDFHRSYDMIETTAFYESYKHALKRLQLLNTGNFPLPLPLLQFVESDKKPAYLEEGCVKYDPSSVSRNARKRKRNTFFTFTVKGKNEDSISFDKHQQMAFEMALSNSVSLIQGPPGTGKTFLGLEIVKWLVENASVHMKAPILIVCYTNHALDQFLEGTLSFTQKVIRVGGQSKNASLEPYNLDELVRASLGTHGAKQESVNIAHRILRCPTLQKTGCYTQLIKDKENLLCHYESLLVEIDDNPIYSKRVASELWPAHFICEVLRFMFDIKNSDVWECLIVGIKYWMCLSLHFLYVYEEFPSFLFFIIKELIKYIENSSVKIHKKNINQTHHSHCGIAEENAFFIELWNIFRKHTSSSNVNAEMINFQKHIRVHVKAFLQDNILDGRAAFNILESAAQKCLSAQAAIEVEEHGIWNHGLLDRWTLYFLWKSRAKSRLEQGLKRAQQSYTEELQRREVTKLTNNVAMLRCADVFGLTTVGAAKHWNMLQKVGPRVVVVEEAAEVLEAHIVTSLTETTEHLILIGDHKQLRPNPTVYDLARKYKFDISMFERLLRNGVPSHCLQMQHRMRPCIAELLVPEFYENLENHPSVLKYEGIKGVAKNMYFISHQELEVSNSDLHSHVNKHEAHFLVYLCYYLLQQGYKESSITILTTYLGQMRLLKDLMKQKGIKDVQATTVDNFQGEENDIILLSFVRSNKYDKIGFLEMSNRVCVALSRAKHGLYCIGNFELFYEKCSVWKNVVKKLKNMNLISSALPVRCQRHPQTVTLISHKPDFEKVVHGGCLKKCTYRLACGHTCPLKCHPDSHMQNHDDMPCPKGKKNCSKKRSKLENINSDISVSTSELDVFCVDKPSGLKCKEKKPHQSAPVGENHVVVQEIKSKEHPRNVADTTEGLSVEPDMPYHQNASDSKKEIGNQKKDLDLKECHPNSDMHHSEPCLKRCKYYSGKYSSSEIALVSTCKSDVSCIDQSLCSDSKQKKLPQSAPVGENCGVVQEVSSKKSTRTAAGETEELSVKPELDMQHHQNICGCEEEINNQKKNLDIFVNKPEPISVNKLEFPKKLSSVKDMKNNFTLPPDGGENFDIDKKTMENKTLMVCCETEQKMIGSESSVIGGLFSESVLSLSGSPCKLWKIEHLSSGKYTNYVSRLLENPECFSSEMHCKNNMLCENYRASSRMSEEVQCTIRCNNKTNETSHNILQIVNCQSTLCESDFNNDHIKGVESDNLGGKATVDQFHIREHLSAKLAVCDTATNNSLVSANGKNLCSEIIQRNTLKDDCGIPPNVGTISTKKENNLSSSEISGIASLLKVDGEYVFKDQLCTPVESDPCSLLRTDRKGSMYRIAAEGSNRCCNINDAENDMKNAAYQFISKNSVPPMNSRLNCPVEVDMQPCLGCNSTDNFQEIGSVDEECKEKSCTSSVSQSYDNTIKNFKEKKCSNNSSLKCTQNELKENLITDLSHKDASSPVSNSTLVCNSSASEVSMPHQLFMEINQVFNGNKSADVISSLNSTHDRYVQEDIDNLPMEEDLRICDHSVNKISDCEIPVLKTLHCGHEALVPCNKSVRQNACEVQVEVQLPCKHTQLAPCHKRTSVVKKPCSELVISQMPCGEEVHYKCFEGLQHQNCRSVILNCGHKVSCTTQIELYKCKVMVKHALPCLHEVLVPCCKYYSAGVQCREMISVKPPCGHDMQVVCPSKKYSVFDMQEFCRSKCTSLLPCGHPCTGTDCGKCFKKRKHKLCVVPVIKILPCGHRQEFQCNIEDPICPNMCDIILSCGHKCPGTCKQCFKFNIHSMCLQTVQRVLPCGHRISWQCGAPLPVCEERCLFCCDHMRCLNGCQYPCIECNRPCRWKCEHQHCTLPCYEICDRPPCDLKCTQILPCGHECAGFCGEPCPKICVSCDDKSAEIEMHGRYVLLEDCQHSLPVETLKQYFEERPGNCCPVCPICGTVITKNRRFGHHIKMWLKSYHHSSEVEHNETSRVQPGDDELKCYKPWERTFPHIVDVQKASSVFEVHALRIIKSKVAPSFFFTAIKVFNNYCVLAHIKAILGKSQLECYGLLTNYRSLCSLLRSYCSSCSEQQALESCIAVRRLAIQSYIRCSKTRCVHRDKFVEISLLVQSKKFGSPEDEQVVNLLNDIKTNIAATGDCCSSCCVSMLLDFIHNLRVVQESSKLVSFDFLKYFDGLSGTYRLSYFPRLGNRKRMRYN